MSFRPQFAYPPTPRGYQDEAFSYSFDSSNIALLNIALAAGGQANNIPFQLEPDAAFILRAMKVESGTGPSTLALEFKTAHGDYLCTTYVPLATWLDGGGTGIVGKMFIPLESEIECPPGSVLNAYLYNPTAAPVSPPAFTLYGVKRRLCYEEAA